MGFLTIAAGIYSSIVQGGEGTASLSTNTSVDTGESGYCTAWHPDGDFVASGKAAGGADEITIYSWNGTTLTSVETVDLTVQVTNLKWSANGNFLAVTLASTTNEIRIYSWNSTDTLTSVETIDTDTTYGLSWHPNGNYLAVGKYTASAQLEVYSWNGVDTLASVETINIAENVYNCEWSHCGDYLASCGATKMQVYEWNGTDTLTLKDTETLAAWSQGIEWSLDDNFVFFSGTDATKTIIAYEFDGTNLIERDTVSLTPSQSTGLVLSKEGGTLFATNYGGSDASLKYLYAYTWDSSAKTLTESSSLTWNGEGLLKTSLSPDNKYLASGVRRTATYAKTIRVDNTGLSQVSDIIELTSSATINSGGSAWPCDWHSNGNYIAYAGNMTGKQICVASWNGSDTLTEVETINPAGGCYGLNWHPTTEYLAVTEYNDSTNSLNIYSWNGSDTLASVAVAGNTTGYAAVHWHPDGDYVAAVGYNASKGIVIYSWNGSNTLTEVESINTGAAEYGVRWSADGDYLAVCGNESTKDLKVYEWNGTDTLTLKDSASFGAAGNGYSPRWKSDGTYVFASAPAPSTHQVYAFSFNGTTLTEKATLDFAQTVRGIDILDDKYISLGLDWVSAAATNEIMKLYEYDFDCDAFIMKDGYTSNARGANLGDFDNTGEYIACPTLTSSTSVTLRILKIFQ